MSPGLAEIEEDDQKLKRESKIEEERVGNRKLMRVRLGCSD